MVEYKILCVVGVVSSDGWPDNIAAVTLGGEAEVLVGGAALAELLGVHVVTPCVLILPLNSCLALYCDKNI